MCASGTTRQENSSTDEHEDALNTGEKKPLIAEQRSHGHNGFLLGTISLALVVTASSVTMGFMQSRRDTLGCDTMCVGSLTSARSALSLVGATIIGRWSDSKALDKLGGARKFFLLVGIVASMLELLIASQAKSIHGLWAAMIPSALLQQNFNILKALFGEYHDSKSTPGERAGSVGKLGMAVGLAFMVGPLASSTFFQTYEEASIFSAVCLVLAVVVVYMLPTPKTDVKVSERKKEIKNGSMEMNQSIFRKFVPDMVPAARTPPALFIMGVRIAMALSFHIFMTIWAVALRERFNFGPQDYGRYFGFIGFAFALSQGFFAKSLLNQFGTTSQGRTRLLLLCSMILGGGRMLAFQTQSIKVVYALFGVIITALGVVNTIFTADTSKIANPQDLGGLFGVLSSVESLAGIVGPVLGGGLAKIHPTNGPLFAVVSLYGIVFSLVYWGYERLVLNPKTTTEKKNL